MRSKISRRSFLAFSAASIGVGILAACAPAQAPASGGSGAAPAAAGATITYWDWWGPSANAVSKNLFDRLPVALKEKKPDLELNYQNVPFGDEYFRKFLAAHAADDTPDVMHSSVYWARDFFDKGALLDLKPFIEKTPDLQPDKFINGALLQAVKGPAQYGIPGEGPDSLQIFYNRKLFEAAGVTTKPEEIAKWTWQEFTDAAKALTKMDGDQVSQSGFMVPKPDASSLSVWASCHGVGFYAKNADGVETGVGFNDKNAAIDGLNWTLDLLNKAKVSKPITPQRQDWQEFMQGTAAMAVDGPWSYGQLRTDMPDLDWFTMLFPAANVDGGKQGTAVWNNMLVVPTKSKNKDAGWSFLEFWCGLDWMKERLAIGDWMAPRKDFYESAEYKAKFEKLPVLSMVPTASAAGTPLVFIQQSALDAAIQPIMDAIILGQESVESGVDKLITQCNEVLAKAGYQ